MKKILILLLFVAGCGLDYYGGGIPDSYDWTAGIEPDFSSSYEPIYGSHDFSYAPPDYESRSIDERDRDMEQLRAQLRESERRSRLWRIRSQQPQQYEPYSLDEQKYQRYRPLDELSPSSPRSYHGMRPLYEELK